MTPEEIVKAANAKIDWQEREITRLKNQVDILATALNSISSTPPAEATAYYQVMEENHYLFAQISHLEMHNAVLTSESERFRMDTQEATALLENQLAAANQKDADLSSKTRTLEQRLASKLKENDAIKQEIASQVKENDAIKQEIASQIKENDAIKQEIASKLKETDAIKEEIRRLAKRNAAMDRWLSIHQAQKKDLEYKIEELERQVEDYTALINARDDINTKLAKAKQFNDIQAKRNEKLLAAAREKGVRKEQLLQQALKEKEEAIQQYRDLEDQLAQRIAFEKGLQCRFDAIPAESEQSRRSRDNYEAKDEEHTETIQVLEDQVASLKLADGTNTLTETVKDNLDSDQAAK